MGTAPSTPPLAGSARCLWWRLPAAHEAAVQARIDALARSLDAPRFPAHVTLLGGPDRPLAALDRAARALVSEGPPALVPVGLSDAAAWNRCLVLELLPSPALQALHTRAAELAGRPPTAAFLPHVSLLYAAGLADARRTALRVAEPLHLPPFRPAGIQVVDCRGPVTDWRVLADYSY